MWLVIYLSCTMMHGLTNLKFPKSMNIHELEVLALLDMIVKCMYFYACMFLVMT
jgi:hypothetical protein